MDRLKCHHQGEPYTREKKIELGLAPNRNWTSCSAESQPNGKHVCPCIPNSCGPLCNEYKISTQMADLVTEPDGQLSRVRLNLQQFVPRAPNGATFNSSIIRYKGRLLLAYRTGWEGADCHIATLDETFKPLNSRCLKHLKHPRAETGREDPRLFVFRNRLHIAYIGYAKGATSQLYARLTDDLRIDEIFYPQFQFRKPWEKNWSFFEWENELFAIYSPNSVLHIIGNSAYPFVENHNTELPWSGGYIRGGAPPILINNQYWHWFHGCIDLNINDDLGHISRRYNIGVSVFDAKMPFKVVKQTPHPLIWANDLERPAGQTHSAIFPCGAIFEDGVWRVSIGVQDKWTDILTFDHEWIQEQLK